MIAKCPQLSRGGSCLQRGTPEQATFWAGHTLHAGGLVGKLAYIHVPQNGLSKYLMFFGRLRGPWTAVKVWTLSIRHVAALGCSSKDTSGSNA